MASDKSRVSSQILVHLVDQLSARGGDPRALLAEVSIDPDALADIEHMVPLTDYVRFFERAAEQISDAHFGLRAAKTDDAGSLGALSFLFMSAPTLREAFAGFVAYLSAMQEGTSMELRPNGTAIHFTYQLENHKITPRRQDAEYSIAATFRLVDQYVPGHFRPREVYFEHERAGSYEYYADYFQCNVFFGQPTNAIVFDEDILETRSPRLSARLHPIISAHLKAAMSERETPTRFTDQVRRRLLEEDLARPLKMAPLAARLGLSASALARRLSQEGTHFRDIVTASRMEMAERLLTESRLPISEIALRVGYGENASLTRAFRKQFRQTPEFYRKSSRRDRDLSPRHKPSA